MTITGAPPRVVTSKGFKLVTSIVTCSGIVVPIVIFSYFIWALADILITYDLRDSAAPGGSVTEAISTNFIVSVFGGAMFVPVAVLYGLVLACPAWILVEWKLPAQKRYYAGMGAAIAAPIAIFFTAVLGLPAFPIAFILLATGAANGVICLKLAQSHFRKRLGGSAMAEGQES